MPMVGCMLYQNQLSTNLLKIELLPTSMLPKRQIFIYLSIFFRFCLVNCSQMAKFMAALLLFLHLQHLGLYYYPKQFQQNVCPQVSTIGFLFLLQAIQQFGQFIFSYRSYKEVQIYYIILEYNSDAQPYILQIQGIFYLINISASIGYFNRFSVPISDQCFVIIIFVFQENMDQQVIIIQCLRFFYFNQQSSPILKLSFYHIFLQVQIKITQQQSPDKIMSTPKRNTKKTGPQNKPIKTKKNIKYKAFTKNSVQSNKSELQEQSEEVRNAKEILMMESERFQQQKVDYGFVRSQYHGCSAFDKQSNGDWGTEMIQQIKITKREQLLQKQKIICKVNKNMVKQPSIKKLAEQTDDKNNQRHVNKQTIENQINKLLDKEKQSFEKDKKTYQKDINKNIAQKKQKCKEIKKIHVNTKFDKIFNGTRVKVRQKNVQPQCFGLSPKQVVFDSKIFTQKTMTLQKNNSQNQQQGDKKKTVQYTSLSKSRRIHHLRTCSQNNSYLVLKKQRNITNPQQSTACDRKLSQVIHSTSYQPLNSKWIKQNKNNPMLIKQQVNPHTFCIKQMVASYINKKQSQNLQKSNNQKIIKQLIYKPIELTQNKKQKMKELRHRAKYKSREDKYYQYFTHSLTNSQNSYDSNKEKEKKQIKIKNMHFQLDNKQEIVFKVQNIFNKTKIKDRQTYKNKTPDNCFQKRSELLLKKQNRIKTEPEMTKITHINPYMLKIIQIQQKYKQKIELQKLDIKNVFLS